MFQTVAEAEMGTLGPFVFYHGTFAWSGCKNRSSVSLPREVGIVVQVA